MDRSHWLAWQKIRSLLSLINPPDIAEQCIDFCERLTLVDDFSFEPVKLRPFQKEIIRKLLGTLASDGRRQYRNFFCSLGRKQGKTFLQACLVLWFISGEGSKRKRGHQIIAAAADRGQASIIFRMCCQVIDQDRHLQKNFVINKTEKKISCPATSSWFQSISSESYTKLGLGPSVVICDEVSFWADAELYRVLTTGYGARREPLTIAITTAGKMSEGNLGYHLYQLAKRAIADPTSDPSRLGIIYEYLGDDIFDEANWYQAMPALGDFCSIDSIRDLAAIAKRIPSEQATLENLYLNRWTNQACRWLNMGEYDACVVDTFPDFGVNSVCFIGLDLASVRDIATAVALFELDGQYYAKCFYWVPADNAELRQSRDGVPYVTWIEQGYVKATDGNVCDYRTIEADIVELSKQYSLNCIAYDPWNASQLIVQLSEQSIDCQQWPQTARYLNEPMKLLEGWILGRQIHFEDNPVTRFMFDNCAIVTDHAQNIRPSKAKSNEKIDVVPALANAIGVSLQRGFIDCTPEVIIW